MNRTHHFSKPATGALWRTLLITSLALLIHGCAALSPSFEEPELQITAVEPLPNNHSGNLRFRIHLRVFNPNNTELALSGLSYTLSLAGHKVVTGTSSDLPPIPAFGQDAIVVDASASLMGSIMAAAELIQLQSNNVPYELEARVGLRRSIIPYINVAKRGQIELTQYR